MPATIMIDPKSVSLEDLKGIVEIFSDVYQVKANGLEPEGYVSELHGGNSIVCRLEWGAKLFAEAGDGFVRFYGYNDNTVKRQQDGEERDREFCSRVESYFRMKLH